MKECSACGSVAYCNADCQVAHWAVHKPDCKRIKQQKKDQEKAKEAARSSGSGGSGSGDTSARMAPQRYDEEDIWHACFHDLHGELENMLLQRELDVNWADEDGMNAAYIAA